MTAPAAPEWLKVPGYSHYEWSHRGRARSVDRVTQGRAYRGRELTPGPDRYGYLRVKVTGDDGVRRTVQLHQMVLRAHAGEPGPGEEGMHGPRGQLFNRWPEDLRWGSRTENLAERDEAQALKRARERGPGLGWPHAGYSPSLPRWLRSVINRGEASRANSDAQ
jgi:NUMOD4 motif